jgi:deazaflavin-dependent oxidoreductase (nitroreductase family)
MLSDRALARLTILLPDAGVRLAGRSQSALYRLTAGRLGGRFGRGPVLLLTTTGRRSGEPRCTAVLYGKDGSRLVVVGSNTGSESPPAWALNLLANPGAEVQIGRKRTRVRARQVDGSERTRLWRLMSEQYQGFDIYRTRTARDLKVFLLDPL